MRWELNWVLSYYLGGAQFSILLHDRIFEDPDELIWHAARLVPLHPVIPTRQLLKPYGRKWATGEHANQKACRVPIGQRASETDLRISVTLKDSFVNARERQAEVGSKTYKTTFATAFNTYTVEELLGDGGSGAVYHVKDGDGNSRALKVLKPNLGSKKLRRFKNEIAFCLATEHRNIIHVLDYGRDISADRSSSFYVMPLYSGTLRSLILEGISPEGVLALFTQVLDGIEAAHLLGAVHRDLKPENILYEPDTNTLVIADFGIAKFKEEDLYTAVETKDRDRLANFAYSSPEQRSRGRLVDHRADIYALYMRLALFSMRCSRVRSFKELASNALQMFPQITDTRMT
jgi:serine/threonine protein kinase